VTTTGGNRPRVVIAGGGVAGIETLLALRDLAGDRIEIEIVAPEREFVYRPLAVAGPFDLGDPPRFNIDEIARDNDATHHEDAIVAVKPAQHIAMTRSGVGVLFDALVVTSGAEPLEAIPGAFTYRGADDRDALRTLISRFERDGGGHTIAFAVPSGTTWPLPIYELALITAARLRAGGSSGTLKLVTPEEAPLALFGRKASEAVAELLNSRGIEVWTSTHPVKFAPGSLTVVPEGRIPASEVVALPRLRGRAPEGLRHMSDGFVPVDEHGLVQGAANVYAAGDVTAGSIKQGGIATQQADAVAAAIAARFGAPVEPEPFRPILRGMLLTGDGARFMQNKISGGQGESSETSTGMLWWPEGKIAGRYLSHYLARQAHPVEPQKPLAPDGIPIDIELGRIAGAREAI
jgi:sulfide:quinone oxidoreductase